MVERKRHLAKAVTYRFFGSCATAAIAFAASGDVKIGAAVGVLDSVVKVGLYYVHERMWYRIRWGVNTSAHGHETEVKPLKPHDSSPAPQVVVKHEAARKSVGLDVAAHPADVPSLTPPS
jgi:uncharacterized membrane protein